MAPDQPSLDGPVSPAATAAAIERSIELGDPRIDAFLGRMRDAILATIRKDGSPQATPVWYHWDGEVMRISTTESTRKTHNVRRDGRVSICVDDPMSGTYLTLFGRAEIIEGDPELVRQESWPLLLRYFQDDEARVRWQRIAPGRVVIRLRPDRAIWREGVR